MWSAIQGWKRLEYIYKMLVFVYVWKMIIVIGWERKICEHHKPIKITPAVCETKLKLSKNSNTSPANR